MRLQQLHLHLRLRLTGTSLLQSTIARVGEGGVACYSRSCCCAAFPLLVCRKKHSTHAGALTHITQRASVPAPSRTAMRLGPPPGPGRARR